jgi:hypothetical protein
VYLSEKKTVSSHHFVKEGQEPALFISTDVSYDAIKSLLEWSPFVVVTEDVAERVFSWGIKVDAVISASPSPSGIEVQPETAWFSSTDLLVGGLNLLIENGQKEVYVVARSISDVDRLRAPQNIDMNIIVISPPLRWVHVKHTFTRWLQAGSCLQLFPREAAAEIQLSGLTFSGKELIADKDGLVSVESATDIWLGEEY